LLAIAYTNGIELHREIGLLQLTNYPAGGLKDVAIAPDNSVWVIANNAVLRLEGPSGTSGKSRDSEEGPATQALSLCPDVAKPTAIAWSPGGQLIVCDDGPDQQVKFYDVSGERPKLARTFGDRAGLRYGVPGLSAPTKLYAVRGAGMDAQGNLYVALGFNGAPVGTLVLRSFTPGGELRWELANYAFVDTFGFDPDSDGKAIYSRTAVFDLDLDSPRDGCIWRQRATTIDQLRFPQDPRISFGMTAYLRHLQDRPLLYCIGQYGGGFRLYGFEEKQGYLAKPMGHITAPGETWAWDIAPNGDIWHGDFWRGEKEGGSIRRFVFKGWTTDGSPLFETNKPNVWP
jgi:hypothetical protein